MKKSEFFKWQIETTDGRILSELNGDRWQDADPDQVLRVSVVPQIDSLSRCDVFCHQGDKFVRRFTKGFLKERDGWGLTEYIQCIETEQRRVWIKSDGHVIITHPQFNMRV